MCSPIHRLARCSILILLYVLLGCGPAGESSADLQPVADRFLGSEACAGCHEQEFLAWTGSHHELAMQEADTDNILADFDNASLDYFGSSTEFFRDGDNFVVRTANSEGAISNFVVTHTFGVEPLQQYLVELSGGRLQALPFAWDARPAVAGGQRRYHLYEHEYVGPGDPLHWTGRYFNWNFMCAECHSTNVRMGYDIATDSFDTRLDDVSVGCEACHGPGARHVQQAEQTALGRCCGTTRTILISTL